MRVLMVTPRFPLPLRRGDQVVAYHRLRTLSRDHDVTLATFVDGSESAEDIATIRDMCRDLYLVRLTPWQSLLSVTRHAAQRALPLQLGYYQAQTFGDLLRFLIEGEDFDVLHGILLRVAPYLLPYASRTLLELVDSMELNFRRRLEVSAGPSRLVVAEEHRRLARYEPVLARRFPQVSVVSELDRSALGRADALVLPNGVVVSKSGRLGSERPARVVFSGNLGYHPNREAIRWLLGDVWPRIRLGVPEAELRLVGTSPERSLLRLSGKDGVLVTGDVPSVAAELAAARVAVAPMRSGSGIQNKVLEAMAVGTPVVVTPFATGGLTAAPGREYLVESTAERFAERVIALLKQPDLARTVGMAGLEYVDRHHSWEAAAQRIGDVYRQLRRNPAPWHGLAEVRA